VVGVEVLETRGGRSQKGVHPQNRLIPAHGRGAPKATSEAKGGTPSKVSCHETPSAPEAVLSTEDHGRAAPILPNLSQCEGTCVSNPGLCWVCFSPPDQWTPCRI
jgi:hypothetical protein